MAQTSPTDELLTGVEAYLAALPDADFEDLVAHVRVPADPDEDTPPPKGAERGSAAGKAEAAKRFGTGQ